MIKLGSNNIGKVYFGSNAIGKVYLGNNLVFQSGSGPTPPPPATTVSYLRGGADGSYIDTGITADNTVKVIVWARNWLPYSDGLFGSRTSAGADEFVISATSGADVDRARIRFGTSNTAYVDNAITEVYSHYHKYEYSEGVFKVDDVVKATASVQTFNNNLNIHLFGINTGGTHGSMNFPADICACKIYKNDVLVRDFTAVNSPSVGLYDDVSGTTFTNAGSGSFTYGTFDQSAYTALDYISCSGEQYFDTGIYGTYSMPFVCKCMPTSGAVFHELWGYRSSSSCCAVGFGNQNYANARVYWRFGTNDTTTFPYDGGSTSQTNSELTIVKSEATVSVYKNNESIGSAQKTGVSSSFQTVGTLYVGTINGSGNPSLIGRIYYCGFGASCNYVPAKVNNVAGMYDTYNDVFYPSATGTDFVAGNEL